MAITIGELPWLTYLESDYVQPEYGPKFSEPVFTYKSRVLDVSSMDAATQSEVQAALLEKGIPFSTETIGGKSYIDVAVETRDNDGHNWKSVPEGKILDKEIAAATNGQWKLRDSPNYAYGQYRLDVSSYPPGEHASSDVKKLEARPDGFLSANDSMDSHRMDSYPLKVPKEALNNCHYLNTDAAGTFSAIADRESTLIDILSDHEILPRVAMGSNGQRYLQVDERLGPTLKNAINNPAPVIEAESPSGTWHGLADKLKGLLPKLAVAQPIVSSLSIMADYKDNVEKVARIIGDDVTKDEAHKLVIALTESKFLQDATMGIPTGVSTVPVVNWVNEHPEVSSQKLDDLGIGYVRDFQQYASPAQEMS